MQDDLAWRRVSVRRDLETDLPRVLANRGQVQQVILNLISNGADAMTGLPPGAAELKIRSVGTAVGVTVAITDGGAGIDMADREQSFDALFTTKPGRLRNGLCIRRANL